MAYLHPSLWVSCPLHMPSCWVRWDRERLAEKGPTLLSVARVAEPDTPPHTCPPGDPSPPEHVGTEPGEGLEPELRRTWRWHVSKGEKGEGISADTSLTSSGGTGGMAEATPVGTGTSVPVGPVLSPMTCIVSPHLGLGLSRSAFELLLHLIPEKPCAGSGSREGHGWP